MKQNDYYDSIEDLPVYNYLKIKYSGELSLLLREDKTTDEDLADVWREIEYQVIEKIGLGEQADEFLRREVELLILRNEAFMSQDDSLIDLLRMKEKEYEKIRGSLEGGEFDVFEGFVLLEKYYGFQINDRTTTTEKYLSYLMAFNKSKKHGIKSDTK